MGRLIHAASGRGAGFGFFPCNRAGWTSKAACQVFARASRTGTACPSGTISGVSLPIPEWRCSVLDQCKNGWHNPLAGAMLPHRSGTSGQSVRMLHGASSDGWSWLTGGRLWVWGTPKAATNHATGLEVIRLPRSA